MIGWLRRAPTPAAWPAPSEEARHVRCSRRRRPPAPEITIPRHRRPGRRPCCPDWIVELAQANGYLAQSTSVPGVAQRTGQTVYYVRCSPGPWPRPPGPSRSWP
ncbi:MAG: hypothetical protein WDM92_08170 [Caulobacteraceae bacterium]